MRCVKIPNPKKAHKIRKHVKYNTPKKTGNFGTSTFKTKII